MCDLYLAIIILPIHSRHILITVGVTGRYTNHPDLLEQPRKVATILSHGGQDDGAATSTRPGGGSPT